MPETKVFVMAFYPMNELVGGESVFGMRSNARICEANVALKALVTEYTDYRFIDVNACLYDEERRLKAEWAIDGIHMYPEAYAAVFEELLPFFE